jgi:hypothetical protein
MIPLLEKWSEDKIMGFRYEFLTTSSTYSTVNYWEM